MKHMIVLAAAVSALAVGAAHAQQRGATSPAGSYRDSCRDIMTFALGGDSMLVAQCRDAGGRWRGASLRVGRCRDVMNNDGDLMCRDGGAGGPGGGYPGGGYPGGGFGGGQGGGRPPFGGGGVTLYRGADFSGAAFTTREELTNIPRQYNDMALSLRVEGGAWTVCSDSDFRGNCQTFDRDVRDLRQYGLGEAISSVRRAR